MLQTLGYQRSEVSLGLQNAQIQQFLYHETYTLKRPNPRTMLNPCFAHPLMTKMMYTAVVVLYDVPS